MADTNGTGVCDGSINFNAGNNFSNHPISANISVHFQNGSGGLAQSCNSISTPYSNNKISITNNTTNGGSTAGDTGPSTISYNGKTYQQINPGSYATVYGLTTDVSSCYGGSLISLSKVATQATGSVSAQEVSIQGPQVSGDSISKYVTLPPGFPTSSSLGGCYHSPNTLVQALTVTSAGQVTCNTNCSASGGPVSGAGCTVQGQNQGGLTCVCSDQGCVWEAAATISSSGTSCESASATSFEWLFCPILRLFDSMANTFNGIIENLLDFNTSTYLNPQIKSSWNIMKTISSAVLVIIMLVAVISQAVGGGPVDAYTLRKILPRLVIAVILIQISWIMLVWFIDLADAIGHGVRDFISAPFGGWQNLDLAHLIAPLGGKGTLTVAAIFTSLVVAVAFSGLTIAGVGLLGLGVILTDLLAFVFLVLRQVFIVLAVILFPIAIIAWILPGTQRYWKFWSDNFIKLLLLFPLIMALIYGGRIFAYIFIAANASTIIGVFVLFIGFFGPYWFLPKAFKWGGSLYSAAATGAFNATKNIRELPNKYALSRAQENRQYRAAQRAARIGSDPEAASRWDRLLAGGYNVARSRGARQRQYAQTVAEGQKTARESVAQELTVSGYQNWGHDQKLNALEHWLRSEVDPDSGISAENNEELRLFAFKTLADLGDQDRIRKARQQGKLKGSVWLKGRAENISQLNAQASDMGIENDLSSVSPDKMAGWKGHTWIEWIRQVQQGVIMDNSDAGGGDLDIQDPGGTGHRDPERRAIQLQRAQAQAQRILNNQLVFDRLSADQQEIVRQMATMQGTQVAQSNLAGTQVPAGETLARAAPVRQDVMAHLASSNPRDAGPVAGVLAPRIIGAARATAAGTPMTPDQQGDMQLFHQVYDQAKAPGATPEMQRALDALQQSINSTLSQQVAETERQLTASGSPNVATAVNVERTNAATIKGVLGI